VVRSNGKWEPYAIEINLRKGGTTHPFLTLQFLTDGTYDPDTAIFTAPNGRQKFFVASDHVESPRYRTLTRMIFLISWYATTCTSVKPGRQASSFT